MRQESTKLLYRALFAALFFAFLITNIAYPLDEQEVEARRLYEEAERLTQKEDYDKAIATFNKAIKLAEDEEIREFIKSVKKEVQEERLKKRKRLDVLAIQRRLEEKKRRQELAEQSLILKTKFKAYQQEEINLLEDDENFQTKIKAINDKIQILKSTHRESNFS